MLVPSPCQLLLIRKAEAGCCAAHAGVATLDSGPPAPAAEERGFEWVKDEVRAQRQPQPDQ